MKLLTGLFLSIIFLSCKNSTKSIVEKREYYTVDSVWSIQPGTINTLQFEPLFGFCAGPLTGTSKIKLELGDTIVVKWFKQIEK